MKTSMSRSTFKILFYVKKGSERANGYLPLMCRLTVDGEIKQFSCKLDVPPKLWDVKTARATGKSAEAQKINAAVDRIRVDVNRRYQELMQSDGYVTAARLRDTCLGLGVKRETLLKLFEQHNEEFIKKVGHSRVQGTYNRYRTIYRHLCEFVPKVYRRDDIPLKELNLTFINNFEYFLRTEKKCRTNTVHPASVRKLLPRLRNQQETEVVIVTLPEATPVFEAERLQKDLQRAGINNKWWVVNACLSLTDTENSFLRAKAQNELTWIKKVEELSKGNAALIAWKNN